MYHALFDITKGTFQGQIVIPRKDVCYTNSYDALIGWYGRIGIVCEGENYMTMYMYDSIESNVTGYINLILRNGISFHLISSSPILSIGGDVYLGAPHSVTLYRRKTQYQPVKHRIRHTELIRGDCNFRVDIWSDVLNLICAPGPVAIAFLVDLCAPVDGIVEAASGNMTFREVIPSFHPPCKDAVVEHFHFSMDGSFLHLIGNLTGTSTGRGHLLSVDIYRVAQNCDNPLKAW
jgi:hypothetical protein